MRPNRGRRRLMVAGGPSLFGTRQLVAALAAARLAAVSPSSSAAALAEPTDLDPIVKDGSVRWTWEYFDADADADADAHADLNADPVGGSPSRRRPVPST